MAFQGGEIKRTRLGGVVKETRQFGICVAVKTSLVNMLATPANVTWPTPLFQDSKYLFVQCFARWQANIAHLPYKHT